MKNKYAQISFIADGHINQDILITEPSISAEQIVEMLGTGEAITTIQDGGGVVRVSDWKVIGEVFGTEPEMDYREYQVEGDYELVQPEPKPFNGSRLAWAGAMEEFIYEPEKSLEEITEVLEASLDRVPNLILEEGHMNWTGKQLLREINLLKNGLKNLMAAAHDAGKNGKEII